MNHQYQILTTEKLFSVKSLKNYDELIDKVKLLPIMDTLFILGRIDTYLNQHNNDLNTQRRIIDQFFDKNTA